MKISKTIEKRCLLTFLNNVHVDGIVKAVKYNGIIFHSKRKTDFVPLDQIKELYSLDDLEEVDIALIERAEKLFNEAKKRKDNNGKKI